MKRKIPDLDLQMFKNLTKLSQGNLKVLLYDFLSKYYAKDEIVHAKEFIYAQGTIPIALVAHMDTVFKVPPKEFYYDSEQCVLWSPQGLGADDRAGVFLIMKIIQAGYKPSVILTTDEEKGALGAYAFIKRFPAPLVNTNYVIELDRRGSFDCVFYDCDNKDFVKYVQKFGFVEAQGSFTDISEICPEWEIAGVNLSVGYVEEHSDRERLFFNSLYSTYEKVCKMLSEQDIPAFKYIPLYDYYTKYYSACWYDDKYEWPSGKGEGKVYGKCHKCSQPYTEYELFPVKGKGKVTYFYCPDCLCKEALWCERCQEAYLPETSTSVDYCGDCVEYLKKEVKKCTKKSKSK